MSELEGLLLLQIRDAGLPEPEREYRITPGRRWRWDMAWPGPAVALDIQGGIWSGGAHVRGSGYTNDCQKANAAEMEGWVILHFTREMIESGEAVKTLTEVLP